MAQQGLIAGQPGFVYPSPDVVLSEGRSIINIFGYTQWNDRYVMEEGDDGTMVKAATFFATSLLPQWSGYLIIIGFSLLFALMAWFLTWVEEKFSRVRTTAEHFSTAGRSLKAGLIAVDVFSHWTWPNNILTAAFWCYTYGVTGALWWGAGDVTCIWIFAVLSVELKIRAPTAHTILEIIRVRWGTFAHVVFYFFSFLTNILATSQQLYATVLFIHYLTGISVYVTGFMIPLGVVLYAAVGGLKTTFTTSYIHSVILLSIMNYVIFGMLVSSDLLGSIDMMYERLSVLPNYYPVEGNRAGSYLTAYSSGGFQNFIVIFLGNLAYVFADQSYWQSAVAAKPSAAFSGYLLGSFLFFPVCYTLCFTGLAALVLDLPLSENEVSNGAIVAAVTYVMSGKVGPIMLLISVFMAITSAAGGEMLAAASVFTFDVYRQYIRPKASSTELLTVCRGGVLAWGLFAGMSIVVLFKANVNIVLYSLFPGVVLPSCIPGIVASLLWDRCTATAASASAIIGCVIGTSVWVRYPIYHHIPGGITIDNLTFYPLGLMFGALSGLGSSIVLLVGISLAERFLRKTPEKFDWSQFSAQIELADENAEALIAANAKEVEILKTKRVLVWVGVMTVFLLCMVAWPLLALIQPIFSLANFRFWCILGLITAATALLVATILPIWEARDILSVLARYVARGSRTEDILPVQSKSPASFKSFTTEELELPKWGLSGPARA